MSCFSPTQWRLLDALSDGQSHSGRALGDALCMSRAAIWKHMQHLMAHGIPLLSHPKRGYQLHHPLSLLNADRIKAHLQTRPINQEIMIEVLQEIDSTNRYLKDAPVDDTHRVCLAELQTQGRGRFGRTWFSPCAENLYFSARFPWHEPLSKLSGLSLAVSLAVYDTLAQYIDTAPLRIKWPNDLMYDHEKISGILIEMSAESHGLAHLIIGIGINVNSSQDCYPSVGKPWVSLYDILKHTTNRNQLAAMLIEQLMAQFNVFKTQGFQAVKTRWMALDYLKHQHICVHQATHSIEGMALGVDDLGNMRVEDASGTVHAVSSGESSLTKRA